MSLRRILVAAAALLLLTGARPTPAPPLSPPLSQGDWIADFVTLQAQLAARYANFEYTLTDRRMDLPAIAKQYRQRIATAATDVEQQSLFTAFVAEFHDPHVRIDWAGDSASAATRACEQEPPAAGLAWERAPGFQVLPGIAAETFAAGLLTTRAGKADAIVRISSFEPRAYPQCRTAAAKLRIDPDGACDQGCGDRLDAAAGALLTDALDETLRLAAKRGARRAIVDLVDNEGGSDWVESALRKISGPIASPRVAMLRDPAWIDYLASLDARLPQGSVARRRFGQPLAAAQAQVRGRCDLSAAWQDADFAMGRRPLPCTTLVATSLFSSGLDARGAPDADGTTFVAARYGKIDRSTRLPVVVLVNDNSHSAAELFAAAVQDNQAGQIAGIVTPGAGCGTFTTRGTSFRLPLSGAQVHVPDCVRLRRDGTNERRGITPDIPIPWGPSDSGWMRLEKALIALAAPTTTSSAIR